MLNETFEQRTAIFVAVQDDMETAIQGNSQGQFLDPAVGERIGGGETGQAGQTQPRRHGLKQRLRAV